MPNPQESQPRDPRNKRGSEGAEQPKSPKWEEIPRNKKNATELILDQQFTALDQMIVAAHGLSGDERVAEIARVAGLLDELKGLLKGLSSAELPHSAAYLAKIDEMIEGLKNLSESEAEEKGEERQEDQAQDEEETEVFTYDELVAAYDELDLEVETQLVIPDSSWSQKDFDDKCKLLKMRASQALQAFSTVEKKQILKIIRDFEDKAKLLEREVRRSNDDSNIHDEMSEEGGELKRSGRVEELRQTSSIKVAIDFFEGGFARKSIPNYRELGWMEASPTRLACAIWDYVEDIVLMAKRSGDEIFLDDADIFGYTIPIPDSPKISQLIESFGNLGVAYPNDIQRDSEFKNLQGKLATDFARIQQIYKLGYGVHQSEQNGEETVNFLKKKSNALTANNLQKIAQIGVGYQDKEGEVPHRDLLLWATQAWLFINDPEKLDVAVLSTSSDNNPIYARNVLIKSPLTYYPSVVEGKLDDAKLLDWLIKRNAIRLIAGMAAEGKNPPWLADPDWQENGSSSSELAARRLRVGRAHMTKILFGSLDAKIPGNGSFYERWLNKYQSKLVSNDALPTEDEERLTERGYYAEQQVSSLMEYCLMPAKAEGLKLTGKTRLGGIPEIDGRSGPTADFYLARAISSPQMYSNKLTSEIGRDGSPLPPAIKDRWFKFMETFLDRYYYLPEGELTGITLREAMICCNSGSDFGKIPYQSALGTSENNMPWSKQLELGWTMTKLAFDGTGIQWKNLVALQTHGAGSTYDQQIGDKVEKVLSRNAYYLLTRDFGREVASWPDYDSYKRYLAIEKKYLDQLNRGIKQPIKPNDVSQKDWDQVLKYQMKPTSSHVLVDGLYPSNRQSGQWIRYATNVHDVVRIPSDPKSMNEFERAVVNNPNNDPLIMAQKLIVGNLIIGDLSRTKDTQNMSLDDVIAFMELFSYEFWKKRQNSFVSTFSRNVLEGRKKQTTYQGLGYFSLEEINAMLESGDVPRGIVPTGRSIIEAMQKFK